MKEKTENEAFAEFKYLENNQLYDICTLSVVLKIDLVVWIRNGKNNALDKQVNNH